MIPKTIHYIWFGGNPLGDKELACIESWKRYCPDYKIVRWDETNFDVSQNPYCKEAYANKKWAFVSDYVRPWVLVNYGGIYMDTDVEVIKSLDEFLVQKAFSGFETDTEIPTGIMACEKGFPLFDLLLHDYDKRRFVQEDGALDVSTNVVAITQACLKRGFKPNGEYQVINGFALYPKDWFCPKSYKTGEIHLTRNTHTIHHFAGSWLDSTTQEIDNQKYRLLRKHRNMSPQLAAFLARFSYGVKHKDFHPLLDGVREAVAPNQSHRE